MAQELYHPEFARAGQQAGLQVWRIEKLELVPVPERAHGDFYVGDAYLVLHTAKASRGFIYRLHFWLGKGRQAARPRRAQVGERRGRERLRFAGSERVGREAGVQTGRACTGAARFGLAIFSRRVRFCKRGCKQRRPQVGSGLNPVALTFVTSISSALGLARLASPLFNSRPQVPLAPWAAAPRSAHRAWPSPAHLPTSSVLVSLSW